MIPQAEFITKKKQCVKLEKSLGYLLLEKQNSSICYAVTFSLKGRMKKAVCTESCVLNAK
jgi:hypothetical protein